MKLFDDALVKEIDKIISLAVAGGERHALSGSMEHPDEEEEAANRMISSARISLSQLILNVATTITNQLQADL